MVTLNKENIEGKNRSWEIYKVLNNESCHMAFQYFSSLWMIQAQTVYTKVISRSYVTCSNTIEKVSDFINGNISIYNNLFLG